MSLFLPEEITSTTNGTASLSEYDNRMLLFFNSVRGLDISRLNMYLEKSFSESIIDTIVMIFHIRDCRGGKGERELGRAGMIWLLTNHPTEFAKIMYLIPEYGRWDDIVCLFPKVLQVYDNKNNTFILDIQIEAVKLLGCKLYLDREHMLNGKPVSLAAKWCISENDSRDKKTGAFQAFCNILKLTPRTVRTKYLSPLRSYIF